MSGKIVRKLEGRGEKFSLPVSPETKWEEIGKALADRGYEIDANQSVRRIIRSLEAVTNPGRPRRNSGIQEAGK